MAGLRVFVSSTCYDLSGVRAQLRLFITSLGHEPVMSEFNDVLYDPNLHTHTSCVEEVAGCDVVVLIVGSRFGGVAIPEAIGDIDLEAIAEDSRSVDLFKSREKTSVTQLEVLKAIDEGIPVFSFIEERVYHDHALYEKNKCKKIVDQIEFPSIQKQDTAPYIFAFINFLRHRSQGNSLFFFSKAQDIEETLRKQWSGLLQKLLMERRRGMIESARLDHVSVQLADLRAAILSTIASSDERKIARGVVRFRRLVDMLRGLSVNSEEVLFSQSPKSWNDLMESRGIVRQETVPFAFGERVIFPPERVLLVKEDRTFFATRYSAERFEQLKNDWEAFMGYPPESRRIIFEALLEMPYSSGIVRYVPEPVEFFVHRNRADVELRSPRSDQEN